MLSAVVTLVAAALAAYITRKLQWGPPLMAGFFMRGRMAGMKQFSLRDLLFVIALIAMALGWWIDRRTAKPRYTMQISSNNTIYVLDTSTGSISVNYTNNAGTILSSLPPQ